MSIHSKTERPAVFAGTALALFAVGAAHAQPTDGYERADDVVRVKGEAYGNLEADSPKYTADLIDTPRAITVIGEELLQDIGAASLTDALRTVPGISLAAGEGGQPLADRPFIRGSESTSGLLVDGLRDSSAQTRDVYNLEQIEVSRGPNGAFAGRGAPGGSINLVTKKARGEDFAAGSVQIGNEDQKRITADVNHAVNDDVAVRLNAMWQESDVPGRDGVFDNRIGIAPSLTLGINSPTKVEIGLEHYETEGIVDYGHPIDLTTGQPVEGIDPDNFYGLSNRDFNDTELDSAIVEISHRVSDNIQVRNISRLSQSSLAYIASNPDDSRGNVANGLVQRVVKSTNSATDTFVNQTDVTAQFATGDWAHSLAAGLEYSKEETSRATYSVEQAGDDGVEIGRSNPCTNYASLEATNYNCTDLFNPNPNDPWTGAISLNDPTDTDVETYGAYVFDTITLSEQWLVNLGVRYDDFSTKTSSGLSNEDTFFTYQAGVVFKPRPNGSIYASFGTSANPAGVTAGDGAENISTTNEDLEPEKGRNYELGAKWQFYGDRLSVDAAIFRTEVIDDHVQVEAGRGGAREAIGETRVDGVELSISGQITPTWNVFAGYSYLDAEIIDAGPINTATEGNRLPNTPEHSFSLFTSIQPTDRLSVGGGAQYQSERFGNTANTRSVDEYWRVDAFGSYAVTENVALQVNVQNVFDERYYERVYTTHLATITPARSITGTLRFAF